MNKKTLCVGAIVFLLPLFTGGGVYVESGVRRRRLSMVRRAAAAASGKY